MSEFASKFVTIIPSFKGGGRAIQRELDAQGDAGGRSAGKKAGGGFAASFGGSLKGIAGGFAATMGISALVSGFNSATSAASDLNETVSKSQAIFGSNFAAIDSWAKGAATSFGLSRQAALDAAASFGDMFTQIGFGGSEAAKMSKSVVQMSADLGSFNNLGTDDVANRIAAAFRGEYDSLQAVIPNINAARVEHEAMAASGKKSAAALTAQEKAAAVLAIVQKDGARAMGDFARTSSGAANTQKILAARLEDAKAKFGQALLPVRMLALQGMSKLLDAALRLGPVFSRVGAFLSPAVSAVKGFFSALSSGQGQAGGLVAWIKGVFVPGVMGVVTAFRGYYTQIAGIVGQFVTGMMTRLAPLLPTVRSIFGTIGQIVSVAMQLVQAVITRVTQVIGVLWGAFGQNIMNVVSAVFGALVGIIQPALSLVKGIISLALAVIKGDWSGAWDALKSIASSALALIKGIISGAFSVIRSLFTANWDAIRSITMAAWSRIQSAVQSGIANVLGLVRSLPGRIVGALGDLGNLLYAKGAALIQGLISGILSKIGAVKDAIGSVTGSIANFLPGSPIKEGPLRRHGWNEGRPGKLLGDSLVAGLDASRGRVALASARMAGAVAAPARVAGTQGAPAGYSLTPDPRPMHESPIVVKTSIQVSAHELARASSVGQRERRR